MESGKKVAAVILASGLSKRFGTNKLLQKIGSRTLFEISVQNAVSSHADQVVAVIEPGNGAIRSLVPESVQVMENPEREKGLSRAVRAALSVLKGNYDGYLFIAADQPFFDSPLIDSLIERFKKGKCRIVSASADGTSLRNPMLFSSSYLNEIMGIEGDKGAKDVAKEHRDEVCIVLVSEENLYDIDTPSDLENARKIMEKRERKG